MPTPEKPSKLHKEKPSRRRSPKKPVTSSQDPDAVAAARQEEEKRIAQRMNMPGPMDFGGEPETQHIIIPEPPQRTSQVVGSTKSGWPPASVNPSWPKDMQDKVTAERNEALGVKPTSDKNDLGK